MKRCKRKCPESWPSLSTNSLISSRSTVLLPERFLEISHKKDSSNKLETTTPTSLFTQDHKLKLSTKLKNNKKVERREVTRVPLTRKQLLLTKKVLPLKRKLVLLQRNQKNKLERLFKLKVLFFLIILFYKSFYLLLNIIFINKLHILLKLLEIIYIYKIISTVTHKYIISYISFNSLIFLHPS